MIKKDMEPVSFIFSSDSLELKSEGENFFVEGYISTSDVDLVNDIVTKNCLMDMAEQMKTRAIKFDVEHESFRGKSNLEVETNKTIIPAAKVDDFLVDKKGLKVRAMLNRHSSRFEEVKGSIEDGFLDAFSIAYIPVKSVIEERNGSQVRMLDQLNLLNVAFTGNPVNTEARMTNVFAKSLQFLEEKENHNHISDNSIKQREVKQMTEGEKETNDEVVEESKEEAEVKDEVEAEAKPEEVPEEAPAEAVAENEEVKALTEKVDAMQKEMAEVKALLKKPMVKSKVSQIDKSDQFVEEKAQNPLDLI